MPDSDAAADLVERVALLDWAWALAGAARAALSARAGAASLLPGGCREEEVAHAEQCAAAGRRAAGAGAEAAAGPARARSTALGYAAALGCAATLLTLMQLRVWPGAEAAAAKARLAPASPTLPPTPHSAAPSHSPPLPSPHLRASTHPRGTTPPTASHPPPPPPLPGLRFGRHRPGPRHRRAAVPSRRVGSVSCSAH